MVVLDPYYIGEYKIVPQKMFCQQKLYLSLVLFYVMFV